MMEKELLKTLLIRHEGIRLHPYRDITGKLTIGVGRNLDDKGINKDEALYLLDNDIAYIAGILEMEVDFFDGLSDARQMVLIDMCFNLGLNGLLGFKKMMDYLKAGRYDKAADEMLVSKWARQVGRRAIELSMSLRADRLIEL